MTLRSDLADAWSDLFLGGRCAGCGRPGRTVCGGCDLLLRSPARACWPDPVPSGLPVPACVAAYDGPVRELLLALKEQGRYGLHRRLGGALATSAAFLLTCGDAPVTRPVALVPVPSRPAVVRRRGHDPLLRMTRVAAAMLRARGVRAEVVPALRQLRRVEDQSRLGTRARAVNLSGAFGVWPGSVTALAGKEVVVTDDIVTTGATAADAARALRSVGTPVRGLATVAATRRWHRLAEL